MADGLLGQLPLEMQPELQGINRQQQMAQMLMQQAFQQPQGQMVSGRYVAPGLLQQLQPLMAAYVGSKGLETAENKQLELAKAIRQGKEEETASIMEDINAGRNKEALAKIQSSRFGAGKDLAGALVGNVIPKAKEPQVVAPGGALVDASGKVIYQAPYKPMAGEGGMGGMGEGMFTKKGDYIAPGGVFIGKTEVAKDREIARAANELRQGLKELKPEDIKGTETILGDVTQSGFKKYIAGQLGNPALKAQAKVNASAVMQTLQNLPPGPASDKDIMQAKSSFPGYGNAKDLQDWVDNTNNMLERKISNVNQKYGSENWYGAQGISANPTNNPNQTTNKSVARTGKVTSGPNAGKTAVQYSDGSIEYK